MKAICFISARGGSKGIPRKNIMELGNKPLIAYAIESALETKIFSDVIVSTEDEEIAKISNKYGAKTPFMRSTELSDDLTHPEEVLIDGIKKLHELGYAFDIVVMRDCTVPFITKNQIIGAVELLKKSDCDGVFAAIKAHPNPYFGMMELNQNNFLEMSKTTVKPIKRRQDAPIVYMVEGLFIFKTDKLLKEKKMFTSKILAYEIPKLHGHMIDFEIDFKIAECLLENKSIFTQ